MLFPSFKCLHYHIDFGCILLLYLLGFVRLVEIRLLLIFFSGSEVVFGCLLFLFCQLFYLFEDFVSEGV